jgi:hypothetical protein
MGARTTVELIEGLIEHWQATAPQEVTS